MKMFPVLLIAVLILLMAAPVYASGYGTSSVVLSTNSISVDRGASTSLSYKVDLVSGGTWGTTLSASAPSGITVSLSNPSADPTFSGTATVTVASSMKPGNYTITFTATGDDPSTSSAMVTVSVLNATQAGAPPPVTVVKVNYYPFIAGGFTIAFAIVLAIVALIFFRDSSKILRYAGFAVSAASSIYLAATDTFLRSVAYDHYLGLIAYLVLDIVFFAFTLSWRSIRKTSLYALGFGNVLIMLLMLVDVFAGLPASSVYNATSYIGWKYLFGLGTTSISTVSVSAAFIILFLSAGLLAGSSLAGARNEK